MVSDVFGLLWFDDSKKSWRQKVKDAAAAFQRKRWLRANVCHISPEDAGIDLGLGERQFIENLEGIAVYAVSVTQPNNFWAAHIPSVESAPSKALPTEQVRLL